ncbi:MAG: hypothetical protein CVV35_03890 [Methanomicrobiales archaeon HGW-Methanomicrobiales-6]|jgi:hypothetical protein|nr:MAG: hypothetical protein CVV35_03890 [Methanomicrobiales archaeon HGW-Methanomicrobiales-6]
MSLLILLLKDKICCLINRIFSYNEYSLLSWKTVKVDATIKCVKFGLKTVMSNKFSVNAA